MSDCIHARERADHALPPIGGRCVQCDPRPCPDCGQSDDAPCACFIPLAPLALADQKALLARADLSLTVVATE